MPSTSDVKKQGDEAELARLKDTGSGISQVQHHHPILGGIARVGDALLGSLFPSVAANVPGTTMHHNLLVNREEGRVADDVSQQEHEALTRGHDALTQQTLDTTPVYANGVLYRVPNSQLGKVVPAQINASSRENVANIGAKNKMDVATMQAQIAAGKVARIVPWQDPQTGEIGVQAYNAQGKPLGVVPGALPPAAYLPKSSDTTDYQVDGDGNIVALDKRTTSRPVLPSAPGTPAPGGGSRPAVRQPGAGGGPIARPVMGPDGQPLKGRANTQRLDHSYELQSKNLEAFGKPIDDAIGRMGRLQETLDQHNPQADSLVAPELLTIMAGGAGSGLRMTESEISRVVGGRSAWQDLRAKIQHWSTNPEDARTITPEQDKQIRALVSAVHDRLSKKQTILNQARQELLETDDVKQHRAIVSKARQDIEAIDAPKEEGGGSGGVHKVGDIIVQNGQQFRVTSVDPAGKAKTADPL